MKAGKARDPPRLVDPSGGVQADALPRREDCPSALPPSGCASSDIGEGSPESFRPPRSRGRAIRTPVLRQQTRSWHRDVRCPDLPRRRSWGRPRRRESRESGAVGTRRLPRMPGSLPGSSEAAASDPGSGPALQAAAVRHARRTAGAKCDTRRSLRRNDARASLRRSTQRRYKRHLQHDRELAGVTGGAGPPAPAVRRVRRPLSALSSTERGRAHRTGQHGVPAPARGRPRGEGPFPEGEIHRR